MPRQPPKASRLRLVLWLIRGLALAAWAVWYVFMASLACAFSGSSACHIKMPWNFRGEDLMALVIVPGLLAAALFAVTVLIARRWGQPSA